MQDNISFLPTRRTPAEPGLATPNNLPVQLTSFIGRESEIATVSTLLRRAEVRLLTLTGTGGVGKTRLALEVAGQFLPDYPDGVFFVSLAPISDPELVIPTIAHTLDLWEVEAGDHKGTLLLKSYLRNRRLLLLLDNFEQVVEASLSVVELLESCPELNILVTSREALHLNGEHEYVVPTLAVPDLQHLPAIEELLQYEAVALFMQQAQAIKPDFRITSANAATIAEICVRLDGLPLALVLAASRIKLLPPKTLLQRLEHRLSILTDGPRNLPPRQRTLRNTIAWSYDLLSVEEQRLFRRLSVFVGGCTLEAIEAISTAPDDKTTEILNRVTSLVDKSLLQQVEREGNEPRLLFLETIREYALEQLIASGEMEATRQAQAGYYLRLAEETKSKFGGPEQTAWLERLESEHDNMRSVMQWLLEKGETEDSARAIEMALQLGAALREFWSKQNYSLEALNFLERALARSQGIAPHVVANALSAATHMAYIQDKNDLAEELAEESLRLYRELENTKGIALSLHHLERVARTKGDLKAARSRIEESLELWTNLGNRQRIGWSLFRLARQLTQQAEYAEARHLFEESLAIFRELEYKEGIAYTLLRLVEMLLISLDDLDQVRSLLKEGLVCMRELDDKDGESFCIALAGRLALLQGDVARARVLIEDSLLTARQLGNKASIAEYLRLLAEAATTQGDYVKAGALYQDSLELYQTLGDKEDMISSLEGLASVLVEESIAIRWVPENSASAGNDETSVPLNVLWASRLCGMAESLREKMGTPLPPIERDACERTIASARSRLGEEAFAQARTEGRGMSLEEVFSPPKQPDPLLTELEQVLQQGAIEQAPSSYPAGLTEREVEVLRLVAQGQTNAQIAEQLIISPHTVNAHVRSIFNKLDVNSRNAATRFAIEHHLT
ncbi:MAG TPA: LuxR C-terminal-related transcriptional regulator [Ktedonobacteraceae bacterium]|nr:LuxR C-terminal-related transcriptional regulator [Ktedonobacteraceae bacterium]